MTADIIDAHLTSNNNDYSNISVSGLAKLASVNTFFQSKKEINGIKNYRTLNILKHFSKIYEKFLTEYKLYHQKNLSGFIFAYRKGCNSNYVFIWQIETWKSASDNNHFTGAVLMNLSKGFDCIPYSHLITKSHAYGLSFDTVTFLSSNQKKWKQNIKVNNAYSCFYRFCLVYHKGLFLDQFFFDIFFNDLFSCLTK